MPNPIRPYVHGIIIHSGQDIETTCVHPWMIKQRCSSTSGQDGGMGRHALPPHATIEGITTRPQNTQHTELSEN